MMITLSACGNSNPSSQSSTTDGTAVSAAAGTGSADTGKSSMLQSGETSVSAENTGSGKPLAVYFSWSGHLQQMAEWVADETGGDLVRVVPKEAHPDDYNAAADRAKKEQDDGTRPAINVDLTQEQLAQYDTVFLGFPVWWYDLPMPMCTFLDVTLQIKICTDGRKATDRNRKKHNIVMRMCLKKRHILLVMHYGLSDGHKKGEKTISRQTEIFSPPDVEVQIQNTCRKTLIHVKQN